MKKMVSTFLMTVRGLTYMSKSQISLSLGMKGSTSKITTTAKGGGVIKNTRRKLPCSLTSSAFQACVTGTNSAEENRKVLITSSSGMRTLSLCSVSLMTAIRTLSSISTSISALIRTASSTKMLSNISTRFILTLRDISS